MMLPSSFAAVTAAAISRPILGVQAFSFFGPVHCDDQYVIHNVGQNRFIAHGQFPQVGFAILVAGCSSALIVSGLTSG